MKHLKTTIIIALAAISMPICGFAQTSISYSYDTAGNRTGRSITVSPVKERDDKATKLENTQVDDMQDIIQVTADSRAGTIVVTIPTWQDCDNCHIAVFNSGGTTILTLNPTSATTTIDISTSPAGTYILQVTLNGKTSTWKIAYYP